MKNFATVEMINADEVKRRRQWHAYVEEETRANRNKMTGEAMKLSPHPATGAASMDTEDGMGKWAGRNGS